MATLHPPTCTAASTTLGYILMQLAASGTYDEVSLPGLPGGLHVSERDLLVVTTPTPAPMFRAAAEWLAAERRIDVALLRIGDLADDAVTVIADLTLAALPHSPYAMRQVTLWAGLAGQVWFVPATFGPSVELTSEGLMLDLVPPYMSLAERDIGVARAARDIGRILSPLEAR